MSYSYLARVSRIVDGDTVRMTAFQALRWPDENIATEREFVIRLLGVDTPERRAPTKAAGDAATVFVRNTLYEEGDSGEPVACEIALDGSKDVYGRWIGRIKVDGQDLAGLIIEAGHGVAKDYSAHRAALMGYSA